MCGIVGISWHGRPPLGVSDRVFKMLETVRHRGPNSTGSHSNNFVQVAFARLSILDPEHGDQPFRSSNGRITCFVNGEIYNHVELRRLLGKRGCMFRTGSDAEVLPHLYEHFGDDAIGMLRGMFVVCILDEDANRVLLARDPVGIKQMYYSADRGTCVFGSEMKAVLASGLIEPRIRSEELPSFLSLFYTPGNRTLLENVHSIPAGCMVEISGERDPVTTRYTSLPTKPRGVDTQATTEEVRESLIRSVENQLEADVPLGLSLSGGVDSTAIAYALAELGRRDILALTVSYDDTPGEESDAARQVAKNFGMRFELLEPSHFILEEDLPFLAWMSDAPIADPALYSQYIVANAASQHVAVLLSGAGGDELFGGYPSYFLGAKQRALRSLPSLVRRLIAAVSSSDRTRALMSGNDRAGIHGVLMSSISDAEYRTLANRIEHASHPFTEIHDSFRVHGEHDLVNQQMLCDLETYLPEQILPMIDRATMAASIEARVPLIDLDLIDTVAGMSAAQKLGSPPSPKRMLKQIIGSSVPEIVLSRRKIGLPSPMKRFIASNWDTMLPQVLLVKDSPFEEWVPREWIESLLVDERTASERYRVLGTLLIFAAWHKWFVRLGHTHKPECSARELFELPQEK